MIYDYAKTTKQFVFAFKDETTQLLQSRTIQNKSEFAMVDTLKMMKRMIDQEAVFVTNTYYHIFMAGCYCYYMINTAGVEGPSCRYHMSKETFLPTVTSYVYGKAIEPELKSRLDRVLKIYLESGIEDFKSQIKPKIAFRRVADTGDVLLCIQNTGMAKMESVPKNVTLTALKKTIILSAFFFSAALFFLVLESSVDFFREKCDRSQNRKKFCMRPRALEHARAQVGTGTFRGRWSPCQVTHFEIAY